MTNTRHMYLAFGIARQTAHLLLERSGKFDNIQIVAASLLTFELGFSSLEASPL